jgi:UDP-glucose 4-epimerase
MGRLNVLQPEISSERSGNYSGWELAMKTALVTGASGFIGLQLLQYLVERGYRVRALLRPSSLSVVKAAGFDYSEVKAGSFDNESLGTVLPRSAEIVQGDIIDHDTLRRAVANVDVIFHLAAQLHIDRPSPAMQSETVRINVEGTRRLVEVARAARVGRFIFFSTINVYGPSRSNELLTEDSPLHPDSLYAETKIQAEQLALAQLPTVVLRLAAVYGAGMKGNYVRLVNALRKKRFVMIGAGSNRRTLIHHQDVCKAAVLAAETSCALGQTYNVSDGQVHTLQEIIGAICKGLDRSLPRFHLPIGLVRWTAGFLEAGMSVVGHKSPICRAMVDKIVEDIAVSGDKIRRQLGFQPDYFLDRGWRQTVHMRAA